VSMGFLVATALSDPLNTFIAAALAALGLLTLLRPLEVSRSTP
jgi:hypothetical protein